MASRWQSFLMLALFGIMGGAWAQETTTTSLPLFNGIDFSGWKPILYQPGAKPEDIWSVRDGILVTTGSATGYLRTTENYANYVLRLEWRWPKPRGENSGVMLHVQEPDGIWPTGFEAQLYRRRAGDFLLFGAAECAEHHIPSRKKMGENHIPFVKSSEKSIGAWNTYEIRCVGNSIELKVNGVFQNKITRCSPARGMIALKAENSGIEFRNITLEKLDQSGG